jgi:C2 domain/Ankyrin repeats (3 copies)/Ankyrin repeat
MSASESQLLEPGDIVHVWVLRGKKLAAKDSNGKSDPYVKLFYGGKKWKSTIKKKTLGPIWQEDTPRSEWQVEVPKDCPQEMRLEVWDYDKLSSDDFMGQAVIDLSKLSTAVSVLHLPLSARPSRTERVSGEITVQASIKPGVKTVASASDGKKGKEARKKYRSLDAFFVGPDGKPRFKAKALLSELQDIDSGKPPIDWIGSYSFSKKLSFWTLLTRTIFSCDEATLGDELEEVSTALVARILEGGADPTVRSGPNDGNPLIDRAPPLWLAVWNGLVGVMCLLLKDHPDPDAACHTRTDGHTPLMAASQKFNLKAIEFLLKEAKASPSKGNETDTDALMMICNWGGPPSKTIPAIQLLLDNGADINHIASFAQNTALHMAAENGHPAITEFLLENGAKVIPNDAGITPLHSALWKKHQQLALMLVAPTAEAGLLELPMKANNNGPGQVIANMTALGCAVARGMKAAFEKLVEAGADLDAPFMFAGRSEKTVRELAKTASYL